MSNDKLPFVHHVLVKMQLCEFYHRGCWLIIFWQVFLLQVELVANGQLAVEKIQTGQYDMILMDLQMPVLDGLSATKAIRALESRVSDVPIFALTADVMTRADKTLEAMGLDGYLTKPIDWESLSRVISRVVHKERSERGSP